MEVITGESMNGQNQQRGKEVTAEDTSSEAALGGADAVNDTPGIARHGTTPGSQIEVGSATRTTRGGNRLIWLAVIVALGLILAYAAGMLR